ncbi:MAG: hypothetical protein MR601_01175 [Erysipelotrichaceae bacterium]|nr:hypothetical protein [Erysipelotrichaceae bacterium]
METKSSLTFKRILITSLFYFLTPFFVGLVNKFIDNLTISYTLIFSIVGFFNITYNWDLFALHYNRSKKAIGDTIFFTLVALASMGLLTYLNINYIYGYIIMSDRSTLLTYYGGAPLILIVFCFIFSFNTAITFKCILDRIKISSSTIQLILFSGLMFALLFNITYLPLDINTQVSSFLFYSILYMIFSYIYNQTRSILPSIISLSIILFILNIINVYL